MMGIKARDMEVDLKNSVAEVTKHMAADPRRISQIDIELHLPATITEKQKKILEHTATNLPGNIKSSYGY